MAGCTTVSPVRVLVVEDDPDTRRLLTRWLNYTTDYSAIGVDDFDNAVAAAKETKFDLMLIDIGLPGESGVDLLKHLLESGPCRALALTGYDSDGDIKEYKKAGFAGCIVKPIDPDKLLSSMKEVLSAGSSS